MTTDQSTTAEPCPAEPGEVFHTTVLLSFLTSERETSCIVARRGQEFTVTEAMIEANRDRLGFSFLDVLHSAAAQVARFGQVVAVPGPWPTSEERLISGTVEWSDAREAARVQAHALLDATERREALARVEQRFGRASTSKTMATYATGRDRQEREAK